MKKKNLQEKMAPEDLKAMRDIIRSEIAELFFDLYRKRAVWTKK